MPFIHIILYHSWLLLSLLYLPSSNDDMVKIFSVFFFLPPMTLEGDISIYVANPLNSLSFHILNFFIPKDTYLIYPFSLHILEPL